MVIDPGHNPGNFQHTAEINRTVDIGTNRKECDTTGTSTERGVRGGRRSPSTWRRRMRTILQDEGATVKLTQDGDRSWGPCVDERARIGNTAHADAVVSIHADGSAAGNRGFHVILPGPVHAGGADTRPIVGPSRDLGERIAGRLRARAPAARPPTTSATAPGWTSARTSAVSICQRFPRCSSSAATCATAKDAALLTSGAWRQKAAQGISEGIVSFLRG